MAYAVHVKTRPPLQRHTISSNYVRNMTTTTLLHRQYPHSVIVIQGILPSTSRADGLLEPRAVSNPLFGKRHSSKYKAELARRAYLLWPSGQAINTQLARFCESHECFVYFDANALFLDAIYDPKNGKRYKITQKLIPRYSHLSLVGFNVLLSAIFHDNTESLWKKISRMTLRSKTTPENGVRQPTNHFRLGIFA